MAARPDELKITLERRAKLAQAAERIVAAYAKAGRVEGDLRRAVAQEEAFTRAVRAAVRHA